jgi:L-gulonolactone oxidase
MAAWRNWVGYETCTPARVAQPADAAALSAVLRQAAAEGHIVRVAGSGHSFTPLVPTDGVLVSLDRCRGLLAADAATGLVTMRAGTKLHELGPLLRAQGLALENQGDIDRQSIAGAIGTGTHGTGTRFGSLSTQVRALTLMTADGEEIAVSPAIDADLFDAARVSFGSLGIMTDVTLQAVPAFNLRLTRGRMPLEACLAQADRLNAAHRHFEFYWFPHQSLCATKLLDQTDEKPPEGDRIDWFNDLVLENGVFGALCQAVRLMPSLAPSVSRLTARVSGEGSTVNRSYRLFSTIRTVRFQEMEYAVPAARGADALRELQAYIATKRIPVNFPIEYRWVKGDTIWLSPDYRRDSVHISVHQFRGMKWRDFFDGAEAILRNHGGRPHWGKWHSLTARELRPLYPRWDDFLALREKLDPKGRFLNAHLRRLFGLSALAQGVRSVLP